MNKRLLIELYQNQLKRSRGISASKYFTYLAPSIPIYETFSLFQICNFCYAIRSTLYLNYKHKVFFSYNEIEVSQPSHLGDVLQPFIITIATNGAKQSLQFTKNSAKKKNQHLQYDLCKPPSLPNRILHYGDLQSAASVPHNISIRRLLLIFHPSATSPKCCNRPGMVVIAPMKMILVLNWQ